MGIEDRDWFREEPSKAWERRWEPDPPYTAKGLRRSRLVPGASLAIFISGAIALATWHWQPLPISLSSSRSTPPARATAAPHPSHRASNVVRLHETPGLDVPTTAVAKWTLTDPRFGTVEVYVPVGETPRKALTVALAQRGYQVIP